MGHDHVDEEVGRVGQLQRSLLIMFFLTFLFMVVEVVVGIIANSLALLADAGHMLSDVMSLGLSVVAVMVAQRPKNARYTFGYNRAEVLAAFINGMSLVVISGFIVVEAVDRFNQPLEVQGPLLLAAAITGLLVNIYGLFALKDHTHENLNASSAFYHIVADLLGSIAAIVAGVMIILTGNYIWDLVISLLITVLIMISGFKIIARASRILMQRVPKNLNVADIQSAMETISKVERVHDLHIWAIDEQQVMLTAHVEVGEGLCQHDRQDVMIAITSTLKDRYRISHSTIQIEHPDPKLDRNDCCY